MSLKTQMQDVETAVKAVYDASAEVLKIVDRDENHLVRKDTEVATAISALDDAISAYNDAIGELEFPYFVLSSVGYWVVQPEINFNGVLYAAEDIGDNYALKSNMIAAGISAIVPAAVADFSGDQVIGPAPLTVEFTNVLTGEPLSYLWDFGDGSETSTEEAPIHVYTEENICNVTLTVTDKYGSSTLTKPNYVTVQAP